MDYKEIVTVNLNKLLNSTIVSGELATLAFQNGLVTQEEFEQLNAPEGPWSTNYNKGTFLYTRIARKWTNSEFHVFLSVLERSGNARAVEIITSKRSGTRSTNDLVEEILAKRSTGSFEGYLLEDELEVKLIVQSFDTKPKSLLDIIRSLFKSEKAPSKVALKKKERLCQMMTNGKVWWNDSKPQLPPDYIERRVFNETTRETTLLGLVVSSDNNDDIDWNKWRGDQVLILLVDSPGMGKSCALTRIEQELREKLDQSPRVIIRINLNSIGNTGVGEIEVENGVEKMIRELFQPLKHNNISVDGIDCQIFVLLDGLDEVLPQNQESVLSVLRFLLSEKSLTKGWVVEKVVLSTRPHLKDLIESEFNVQAYFLVPLTEDEQVGLIQKRTGRTDAWKLHLDALSSEMRDLLSNPLMLSMFCSVVMVPGEQSGNDSFNQYEIYTKFMVKKHELYVLEKIGRSNVPPRVLKQMLTSNVPFYNYMAIREVLGVNKLRIIVALAEKAGAKDMVQVPSPEKLNELLSFGIVDKVGQEVRFAHRSFAEFFYARLMTDVNDTPGDVRNAMFALGYNVDNNVAKFASCVVGKDSEAVHFVSSGWTEFVPEGEKLRKYIEEDGNLCDHILSNAIEYEVHHCSRKIELLITDVYLLSHWLCKRTDEPLVTHFLLNKNNTRILAALAFYVDLKYNNRTNVYRLKELCFDLLLQRIASMPIDQFEVITQDILRDTRDTYSIQLDTHSMQLETPDLDQRIYTFLASASSREKLQVLIVNEETRVTDLIGCTGLLSVSTCLGEEFLPKRLLKFRYKFGGDNQGKSLFQSTHSNFPQELMERVWKEIEDNIHVAVQVVQDDGNYMLIRRLENDLKRLLNGSSELRESRRRLLISVLAMLDRSSPNHKPGSLKQDNYFDMVAYEKLKLKDWEVLTRNQQIRLYFTEELNYLLGCLMISAINEERIPTQQHQSTLSSVIVRAPLDLIKEVIRGTNLHPDNRILFSFIGELSRKELLDLATMKTSDPVLLSDLPSVWELFFHVDKGLAKVKRQKAMAMLNENDVLGNIVKDILDTSLSPELELRRVFLREKGLLQEERVTRALTEYGVLKIVTSRAKDLWLKNVQLGKTYIMGVVQLYLDIFQGEVDSWVNQLAARVPVQLLVVAEEKVRRSGGGQHEWANLLKLVQKFIRELSLNKLTLNDIRIKMYAVRYNRECDWYKLLLIVLYDLPEIKNKIPVDYANRSTDYTTWQVSLLRVWIQLFGPEETLRKADEILEDGTCLWEDASREMNKDDGELLHIAVELGSLRGVQWTAYPKIMVNWRDGENRTALELAKEKLGKGHEVTEYLLKVVGNLIQSGFLRAEL